MTKRRFSRQLQQEQISRQQLSERFIAFGWLPTSPVDLGEDFIVHIYFDGRASGMMFHVQEKSVINLAQRKKGDFLPYPFKVSDLMHWEAFSLPVVLMVWDVIAREGRWMLINEVIEKLDSKRPGWRAKSKISVQIPWTYTTDDDGLNNLKQAVGRHVYPLIATGKELQMRMTLTFPDTQEGQEARQAFERHIKEGEPVTLKGRTIQYLQFSDWWEQWFGGYDPDNVEIYLSSMSSSQPFFVSITIISNNGEVASISGIELRVVQAGTEQVRFNNEHQASPLNMRLSAQKINHGLQGAVSFSIRNMGNNVQETWNIHKFLNAVSSGGKLSVDFADNSIRSLTMIVEPQPNAAPNPRFLDLVEKLTFIQERTGLFFRVPEEGIMRKDALAIDELSEILRCGMTKASNRSLVLEAKEEGLKFIINLHRLGRPVHYKETIGDTFVELFGTAVPTGPITREVTGNIESPFSELEAAAQNLNTGSSLSVRVINVEVIETFPLYLKNS